MARSKVSTRGKKSTASREKSDHPPWIQMIQECILANPDDARTGVTRSQIRTYVESTYDLKVVPGYVSSLSQAIRSGADQGIFSLSKGVTGRIKLASKVKTVRVVAVNEAEPIAQPQDATKSKIAAPPKRMSTSEASSKTKGAMKTKPDTKPVAVTRSKTQITSVTKVKSPAKKTSTSSRRGSTKRTATGVTSVVNAKVAKTTAANKAPPKKSVAKELSSRATRSKTMRKRS